jgi:hypothetical protein
MNASLPLPVVLAPLNCHRERPFREARGSRVMSERIGNALGAAAFAFVGLPLMLAWWLS